MALPEVTGSAPATRLMTADEVAATLDFSTAADALASGLHGRSGEGLDPIPRVAVDLPAEGDSGVAADRRGRELLLMPCHGPEGVGIKLVTIARANPVVRGLPRIQGIYALFAADGMSPELLIDGAALTRLRTAATSALATRLLARPDSRRLVVFGAGVQASAHVEAMRAVRPIEEVAIVGSSPDSPRARTLVDRLLQDGLAARVGDRRALGAADIVCTCTPATAPLFDDGALAPGTHVNAVGSYQATMCELPAGLLGEALLVVETEEAARAEAGEIVRAIEAGVLPRSGFASDLGSVIEGRVGRRDADQLTVFKSVGLSVQDLILARALATRLRG
jgi:ornithine cyclodeaminase